MVSCADYENGKDYSYEYNAEGYLIKTGDSDGFTTEYLDNGAVQKIPYSYRTDIAEDDPKNFFAIYATDNSMAPLLDVGDIAIIKKYTEFSNGKTYLLKIKNGKPIIRKIIKSDDERIELQAMNMWNFPTQYDFNFEDIEILGEVVKVENNSAFK